MNTHAIRPIALVALALATIVAAPSAQNAALRPTKTTSKIQYHGGPVSSGTQSVYAIWYGCWEMSNCGADGSTDTMTVLVDFMISMGNSPYAQINSGYTDASGDAATQSFVLAGFATDNSYSHGTTLTEADLASIINDQVVRFKLPQDPQGIYIVFTSADIALVDGDTQFCLTCCQLHGHSVINGTDLKWGFVGHTRRCPGGCGITLNGANTPNNDLAGDSMASWLAHTLTEIVTNPDGVSGWYDRYGLENADKCVGTFGTTYQAANGAAANMRLGSWDFLIQQNWVRGAGKEQCGMSPR